MNDKKIYLVLSLVVLILLVSPVLFKDDFFKGVFTSEETYQNLILINDVSSYSSFSDLFSFNPFHVILNNIYLDDFLIAFLIPLISGFVSLILLYFILRKYNLSDNENAFIMSLFVLTPVFIHKFTSLNPINFAFPLFLLCVLLYDYKNYFAIIFLILLVFISPIISVVFLLFIFLNKLLKKSFNKFDFTLLFFGLISLIIYFLYNNFNFYFKEVALNDVLIEFGSLTGYSIPLIILAVIGVFSWWGQKNKITILSFLIVGFVISFYVSDLRLIMALGLSVFAGLGINKLINVEWELTNIKQISLMLIFYIILFSSILTLTAQITTISASEVEGAKFLSSVSDEGIVLSTEDKGFMIEYLSEKEVFLDGNSYREDDFDSKLASMNDIFYAKTLSNLETLLKDNNISYFFIYDDMKKGSVWSGREEGLQFFLIYSDNFVKLFDNEAVQIYKFSENSVG